MELITRLKEEYKHLKDSGAKYAAYRLGRLINEYEAAEDEKRLEDELENTNLEVPF